MNIEKTLLILSVMIMLASAYLMEDLLMMDKTILWGDSIYFLILLASTFFSGLFFGLNSKR